MTVIEDLEKLKHELTPDPRELREAVLLLIQEVTILEGKLAYVTSDVEEIRDDVHALQDRDFFEGP